MSDTRLDAWLSERGPAALVVREYLTPVDGADGVFFPPTYASGDNFPGGYNIDTANGKTVCLVDSVGAQANRMEPLFENEPYSVLVPQIVVVAGDKRINLLEAGHRAGDAIVRCSSLHADLRSAFKAVLKGDAEPLARIAPTSLVFGVWDSRDTQAKLPRLIASTIRAYDVMKLTRSAQFVPAADYVDSGMLPEPTDKKVKDAYAERGFVHVPASGAHGGVIASGGIRRDAQLSLAALRLLSAGDAKKTLVLRRYILGLALAAFTANTTSYLRQGCSLVLDPNKPREFVAVGTDGRREPVTLTHDDAVGYAAAAAKDFGVGASREVLFDRDLAKLDVSGEEGDAEKATKKASKPKK